MEKTLNNTTANQAQDNVSDLEIWGNGDMFKLLCKASSKQEGWMKSTKAMEIPGVGCVVQVTTQQMNDSCMISSDKINMGESTQTPTEKHSVIAEAVTFVPGVKIWEEYEPREDMDQEHKVVKSRRLVALDYEEDTASNMATDPA